MASPVLLLTFFGFFSCTIAVMLFVVAGGDKLRLLWDSLISTSVCEGCATIWLSADGSRASSAGGGGVAALSVDAPLLMRRM